MRRKGSPPIVASFEKKTDAQKWATDREAELNQNKHFVYAANKKINLHDLIERYIKETLAHKAPSTIRGQKAQSYW